ncbi:branched-chain amino acid transport system permease protein [Spinactinospora alkalitolerans]|uniref:Branched-chain amino acid transport system permease protein n=1 Tax=Spinactinospora alkalitolerans TaxID=687207 RepID=A0A852TVE3_9ACTN|nr:branched-chain amino acid ABC transporter permease [Spinactinospora alkalitolerans]NYE47267.1 branched-chain amino acid transport system permease protein [Spinactinospora alkalitolerans]
MDQFINLTLNGLTNGAVYAALALSLIIIYQATRVVNFAQPALALIAVYIAYTVSQHTGSYWLGFAAALVSGLVMGALTERILIRPVHGRSPLSAIIVTLGLLLVLQGIAGMVWSSEPHSFPYPLDYRGRFSAADVFAVASVGAAALLVFALYRFTPLGLRMRAAAFHPEAARMSGVRVGLMLTAGWAVASVIGALAGMLATPPFLFPHALDAVFVYGITAAVVGGLDNPFGAIFGGLLIGLGLSYVSGYAGPELTTLAALAILVVVLSIRPAGLFTRPTARKV